MIVGVVGILKEPKAGTFGFAGYNDLGYSGVTNSSISVLTTYTSVFSPNGGRIWARITNDNATNTVWCHFVNTTSTVAVSEGIRIAAGEYFEIGPDNLWKGQVYCIAETGTTTVNTIEK